MQIRTSLSLKTGRVVAMALEHSDAKLELETYWRPFQDKIHCDLAAEHYRAAVALAEDQGMSSWPVAIGADSQGRRYWNVFAVEPAERPDVSLE